MGNFNFRDIKILPNSSYTYVKGDTQTEVERLTNIPQDFIVINFIHEKMKKIYQKIHTFSIKSSMNSATIFRFQYLPIFFEVQSLVMWWLCTLIRSIERTIGRFRRYPKTCEIGGVRVCLPLVLGE